MGVSRRREPPRIIDVSMVCKHVAYFNVKVKPRSGEIIWCDRCAEYKEVK